MIQTFNIEITFPVYSEPLKRQIIDILKIQLEDNRSAVWVDEHLIHSKKQFLH